MDKQGLGQAGHTFDDRMAATENGDQNLFDHILLTDDHLLDLAANPVEHVLNFGGRGGRIILMQLWVGHRFSVSCTAVEGIGGDPLKSLATE